MLSDKAKRLGSEPAFPYTLKEGDEVWSGGMTKREYFAALAMQGLIASSENELQRTTRPIKYSVWAVQHADALLEQLAKDQE